MSDDKPIGEAGAAYVLAALPQAPIPANGFSYPGMRAAIAAYLKHTRTFTEGEARAIAAIAYRSTSNDGSDVDEGVDEAFRAFEATR